MLDVGLHDCEQHIRLFLTLFIFAPVMATASLASKKRAREPSLPPETFACPACEQFETKSLAEFGQHVPKCCSALQKNGGAAPKPKTLVTVELEVGSPAILACYDKLLLYWTGRQGDANLWPRAAQVGAPLLAAPGRPADTGRLCFASDV